MRLPISQVIKRLRKENNITQDDLARVLNVTYQSVSIWENDLAYPDVELIPLIANYFGVTTDVLFGTDETTVEYKRQEYLKAIKEQQKDIAKKSLDFGCLRQSRFTRRAAKVEDQTV